MRQRVKIWSAVVLVVTLAWTGLASPARADCLTPEPLMLWTYPADGATDVPIDAELLAVSNLMGTRIAPAVTLNGQPVAVSPAQTPPIVEVEGQLIDGHTGRAVPDWPAYGPGLEAIHFEPGVLAPNTAYTLELSYRPPNTTNASIFEVRFTTGARKAKSPPKPRVMAHAEYIAGSWTDVPCHELLAAQGCFDTIAPRPTLLHVFELASSNAMAWYLSANKPDSAVLWPSTCGLPRVKVRESAPNQCFELRAIGSGGKLGPAIRYCVKPEKTSKPTAAQPSAASLSPRPPSRIVRDPSAKLSGVPLIPHPPPAEPVPPPPVSAPQAPASASGGCSVDSHASPRPSGWLIVLALLSLSRSRRRRNTALDPLARLD